MFTSSIRVRSSCLRSLSVVVGASHTWPRSSPGGTPLRLATSRFEAFRWRMGRRSRAQLAALDWSGDRSPVLDHPTIFGLSAADIIE
jgi:hypothetical protein